MDLVSVPAPYLGESKIAWRLGWYFDSSRSGLGRVHAAEATRRQGAEQYDPIQNGIMAKYACDEKVVMAFWGKIEIERTLQFAAESRSTGS